MRTTDDRRTSSTIEAAQFQQLLLTVGAILVLFGVVAAIAGRDLADRRYREIALVIAGVLASVVAAEVLARHGRPQAGMLGVGVSILAGAVFIAWRDPFLYPALVLSSLLPAAMMLLHPEARARRAAVAVCWMVAAVIAAMGSLRDVRPAPGGPSWLATASLVSAVGAVAGLLLLLFWQGAQRLRMRVDELQKAHLRLREEREWMDMLAAGIVDGVLATDGEGHVKVLNATAERLTGWSRREARGRDLAEVFDVDPPVVFPSDLQEAAREAQGPVSANEPLSLVSRDGQRRLVTMTAAPLRRDTEYVGSVLVFRDVTARADVETFGDSTSTGVMERLGGRAAQEFRNLLTAISGRADLLDTIALPGNAGDHVRAIRDLSAQGTFLARQLLRLYHGVPEAARRLDVATHLRQLHPMLAALLSPDITVTLDPSDDLGWIVAPPQSLDYTLLVLAAGARDAMRDGGEVLVAGSTARWPAGVPQRPKTAASATETDLYVRIAVWMTAHEEADEQQSPWKGPFAYMSKGAPRPMPGFSVATRLIADAGGALVVDTHGARRRVYTIYLPRVANEPAAQPAGRARAATILIVEDNPSVLTVLSETLRHHGYAVLVAADPAEAVRLVQTHPGSIDVGLIDVELPAEPGPRLSARLKRLKPSLQIVFMSDVGGLERAGAEWTGEVAGVLEKPFLPAVMLTLVKRLVDGPTSDRPPN